MQDLGNNYYGKKHNYIAAFDNYINAYNLAKKVSSKNFPDKKNILVNVGNRYYNLGDLEKAREILQEADSLPPYNDKAKDHTEMSWLRKLTYVGAARRYGENPEGYRMSSAQTYADSLSCIFFPVKIPKANKPSRGP